MRFALLFACLSLLASTSRADDPPPEVKKKVDELKKQIADKKAEIAKLEEEVAKLFPAPFEGNWKVVETELLGKTYRTENEQLIMNIQGEKSYRSNGNGDASISRLTFDSSSNPKSFEEFDSDGKLIYRGIFKFEGNNLIICKSKYRGDRPTKFGTEGVGSGSIVQRFIKNNEKK